MPLEEVLQFVGAKETEKRSASCLHDNNNHHHTNATKSQYKRKGALSKSTKEGSSTSEMSTKCSYCGELGHSTKTNQQTRKHALLSTRFIEVKTRSQKNNPKDQPSFSTSVAPYHQVIASFIQLIIIVKRKTRIPRRKKRIPGRKFLRSLNPSSSCLFVLQKKNINNSRSFPSEVLT